MVSMYGVEEVVLWEYGPLISTWIKWKGTIDVDWLWGNGSLCCLEEWHSSQDLYISSRASSELSWKKDICFNTSRDGWPSLLCHSIQSEWDVLALLQVAGNKDEWKWVDE